MLTNISHRPSVLCKEIKHAYKIANGSASQKTLRCFPLVCYQGCSQVFFYCLLMIFIMGPEGWLGSRKRGLRQKRWQRPPTSLSVVTAVAAAAEEVRRQLKSCKEHGGGRSEDAKTLKNGGRAPVSCQALRQRPENYNCSHYWGPRVPIPKAW